MAELKGADRFDYEVVKLMRLTEADNMMLQTIEMGFRAYIPQMEAEDSDFPWEEYIERCLQRIDIDRLLYQMVPIYSRYYTREEIAELIAFYETPLGRKLVKETSQILQEMYAATQAWLEPLIEKIAEDFDSIS